MDPPLTGAKLRNSISMPAGGRRFRSFMIFSHIFSLSSDVGIDSNAFAKSDPGLNEVTVLTRLLPSVALASFSTSNVGTTPGTVGRKNGAFSGFFSGSIGLFLSLMMSMSNRDAQRGAGRPEYVMNS